LSIFCFVLFPLPHTKKLQDSGHWIRHWVTRRREETALEPPFALDDAWLDILESRSS
jgi:hypothetical protein